MEKAKKEELFRKFVSEMTKLISDAAVESGDMDREKADITNEKVRLLMEQSLKEDKMEKVTHNSYIGIAKIMNEHYKAQNELLDQTYEKCKKFLDDNNLPYEEKKKDTDDEEVQDEQGDVQ